MNKKTRQAMSLLKLSSKRYRFAIRFDNSQNFCMIIMDRVRKSDQVVMREVSKGKWMTYLDNEPYLGYPVTLLQGADILWEKVHSNVEK